MSARAAIVTGGSSGIGFAIARTLGELGYAITLSARRPEKLATAAAELRLSGIEVTDHSVSMAEESEIIDMVAAHKDRYGRIDVLVNNAGVGIGGAIDDYSTKHLDLQLDVNVRAHVIATRESLSALKAAGAEHGEAFVFNTASIAGRYGEPWLSVYAATKAAMINWGNGLQKELGDAGIRVTALSPAFVDTPMTEFAKEHVPAEKMIRPEDLGKTVAWLLSMSKAARIPEIVFERIGEDL